MNNVSDMMNYELTALRAEIDRELKKRTEEKKLPVFGVCGGAFNTDEFSSLEEARAAAHDKLDAAFDLLQTDIENDRLGDWTGDLLRVYVKQVPESEHAVLKPYLRDREQHVTMIAGRAYIEEYYLSHPALGKRKVTQKEYIAAERDAGFHSKTGSGVATGGFGGMGGLSGRVKTISVQEDDGSEGVK
jgi:hypothetical protein